MKFTHTLKHAVVVLLAAALALTTPALTGTASAATSSTVQGYVYDATFGTDLSGVDVQVRPTDEPDGTATATSTDSDGYWQVPSLDEGTYTATYSLAGYRTATSTFEVSPGATSTGAGTVELHATHQGTLSGVLTVGGKPVRNECGVISVYNLAPGAGSVQTKTRAKGTWKITLPAGTYRVMAEIDNWGSNCPGAQSAWHAGTPNIDDATPITVAADEDVTVPFDLKASPVITGKVTNPAGEPLGGISVGTDSNSTLTATDGTYRFTTDPGATEIGFIDPAGEYLNAWHDGASAVPAATEVTLAWEQTLTANATLTANPAPRPAVGLTGIVTDTSGKPLRGAMVQIMSDTDGNLSAMSGDNGRWSIARDVVSAGTYRALFVLLDGTSSPASEPVFYGNTQREDRARSFTVGATGTTDLGTVRLALYGSISGEINLPASFDNELVPTLSFLYDTDGNLASISQEPGMSSETFSFQGVLPGRYKLNVTSASAFIPFLGFGYPSFASAWWGGLTRETAKEIVVKPGQKVTGIQINLTDKLVNGAKPKIVGKAKVKKKLRATLGTWNQTTDVTFTYAWKRGSKVVGKKATYKVKKKDAGKKLTVTVTAKHRLGSLTSGSATSAKKKVAKIKKTKKAKGSKKKSKN